MRKSRVLIACINTGAPELNEFNLMASLVINDRIPSRHMPLLLVPAHLQLFECRVRGGRRINPGILQRVAGFPQNN
ncbi:hypothetical protein GWI33_021150 [Rhynchophorus ferrugineus]|uniref:Uncharacterized protein n=1 Tax=Rhynchophorus ferrugineus TaxID=354439 RepID=A0A834LYX0_RHYFE|nr:hypothetical protein GWI33_021150 [Rhynchophorus ferrugineus]